MNKLLPLLIGLLVASAIGFGAYSFYLTHEKKDKVIHLGYTGEARHNDYYASRLFLKRMGISTSTQKASLGIPKLPNTDTVLLISTRRTNLSSTDTDALIDWVKSGGHLIARSTLNWQYYGDDEDENIFDEEEMDTEITESPDPLQRFMGVYIDKAHLYDQDESEDNSGFDEQFPFKDGYKEQQDNTPSLKLNGSNKPLVLADQWFLPLIVDGAHKNTSERVKLGDKNFIIRQKVGTGMITLVANFDFIINEEIDQHDHAELFWQLIHGNTKTLKQPAEVWLIHNNKVPNFIILLWQKFWPFIISLLVLFIAWLLIKSRRFGPIIPKQTENRRSLKEHISSSGNFYWKNQNKDKLIESARHALTRQLTRTHPSWGQESREQQIALLAEQTKMSNQSIERLLFDKTIKQPDDFIQLIRQLENIRKHL